MPVSTFRCASTGAPRRCTTCASAAEILFAADTTGVRSCGDDLVLAADLARLPIHEHRRGDAGLAQRDIALLDEAQPRSSIGPRAPSVSARATAIAHRDRSRPP